MRWQDAFDHVERVISDPSNGSYSRLGVTYVRAVQPSLRIALPLSDGCIEITQDIRRGLSAVVWDCVSEIWSDWATADEIAQIALKLVACWMQIGRANV